MYTNTLTISRKGQIVLPKKIRELLQSDIITLTVNENNQILISPIRDIGGSLSAYQKQTPLDFEEIRTKAWNDTVSMNKHIGNAQ